MHIKGQAAPTRWAAAYWRDQHHAGAHRRRNLVHTSSTSGIYANPGQSNYGVAKSGIVTFSEIAAKELARYCGGVELRRARRPHAADDVVARPARDHASASRRLRRVVTGKRRRRWSPTCVAPTARSRVRRSTCRAARCGGSIRGRSSVDSIENPTRWPLDALEEAMKAFVRRPLD